MSGGADEESLLQPTRGGRALIVFWRPNSQKEETMNGRTIKCTHSMEHKKAELVRLFSNKIPPIMETSSPAARHQVKPAGSHHCRACGLSRNHIQSLW
jgi:hypothetical protein